MKSRNLIFSIVALVAVAVGYITFSGIYPPREGVEGAIGAANRYNSNQITDGDVNLTDPSTQAFLQSDVFHKMTTNPDFQKLVKSESFKRAVKNQDLLEVVAADFGKGTAKDFSSLVASEDYQSLNASEDFRNIMRDQKAQNVISNADFQ